MVEFLLQLYGVLVVTMALCLVVLPATDRVKGRGDGWPRDTGKDCLIVALAIVFAPLTWLLALLLILGSVIICTGLWLSRRMGWEGKGVAE